MSVADLPWYLVIFESDGSITLANDEFVRFKGR